MSIEKVDKELIKEFNEFFSYLTSIRSRYEALVKEAEAKVIELTETKAQIASDLHLAQLQVQESNKKLENAETVLSQNKVKEHELAKLEATLKEAKVKSDEAFKILGEQQSLVSGYETGLKKREKMLEMDERRLKLLDKKLNLIAQDESVKKALKEIE